MRPSVLVWCMTKREGFTLIEVMVAVMIVSIVIAAILQMRGNTNNLFLHLQKKAVFNQYSSFFLWNKNYGFENDDFPLYRLVEGIDTDDDLRRELKAIKIHLKYKELERVDLNELTDGIVNVVFELGKDEIKTEDFNVNIQRLRLQ